MTWNGSCKTILNPQFLFPKWSTETKFINPVQPKLEKFCHFGTTLKNFGHFEWVDSVFGKILSLLWQILNSIGQILNNENGQILNRQSSHLVTLFITKFVCTGHLDFFASICLPGLPKTWRFWGGGGGVYIEIVWKQYWLGSWSF